MNVAQAYFYGVLLGDGHIHYTDRAFSNGKGPMVMLKAADYDFVKKWRDSIKEITGFEHKISKHNPGTNGGGKRQQYKVRCHNRDLVQEAEAATRHKKRLPEAIWSASAEAQMALIVGLMDSEGWINFYLSTGLGQCDMTLGFACADDWIGDFYELVKRQGIGVSKIYARKPSKTKAGTVRKPLRLFKMDILGYVNAGGGFNIRRKADRLSYCVNILNDYTRNYPKYAEYYEYLPHARIEDIV